MRSFRKKRRPGNRGQTAEESAWVDKVKRHGCVCCHWLGLKHDTDGAMVDGHHLLHAGLRRGHLYVVGLCAWHHQGRLIIDWLDHAGHREELGPSLAEGSRPFREYFGDDDWLMERQMAILAEAGAD